MYTPDQRAWAIERVLEGLRAGTPLTVICSAEGMPAPNTVWGWSQDDAELSEAIARAREAGWDALATQALEIADTPQIGEIVTEKPDGTIERKTEDMLGHRKLRIETRLKLLAKWDPKRYGELLKHGNADGSNLDVAAAILAGNARVDGNAG